MLPLYQTNCHRQNTTLRCFRVHICWVRLQSIIISIYVVVSIYICISMLLELKLIFIIFIWEAQIYYLITKLNSYNHLGCKVSMMEQIWVIMYFFGCHFLKLYYLYSRLCSQIRYSHPRLTSSRWQPWMRVYYFGTQPQMWAI